jgi:tetratricopeptide (TPR) repeat protein
MIVRDEERFLDACLASARPAVDEMIVVDTGSTDATAKIAEAAGARVLRFDWQDDFAAARNASLAAARGTHVLVLDADEQLLPSARAKLAAAAADPTLAIGMLPLSDADALDAPPGDVVAGSRRLHETAWVPRFFKNDARLRYRRRVHETLFHDIDATLRAIGGRILPVDAPIAHYGEVKELRRALNKSDRNKRLLELALGEDPSDGDLAGYLALEYVRSGDRARARAIGERHLAPFLEALDRRASEKLRPSPIQLASVLATLQLEDREAQAALDTVRAAMKRCVEPHPNLRFLEGAALEALGSRDAAARAFRDCLAMDGGRFTIPVHPGATSAAPRLRLANLALARNEPREAIELLEPVSGRFATAAALSRAEAWLALNDPARGLMCLTPLMSLRPPPPDMFALSAWASALLGARDPQLESAALDSSTDRWVEPRRRSLVPSND